MTLSGTSFWKMSGSGNDFVFFDVRDAASADVHDLSSSEVIDAICARHTGVGGDGIVLVERAAGHSFGIRYFNRDGSLAELCGNASLCSVTLAIELGAVNAERDFTFLTSSGALRGRLADGQPEIDMPAVSDLLADIEIALQDGEKRIGFARVGVPHLVVVVEELGSVDVAERGRELRHHPALPAGANVNFVAEEREREQWRMRTYERGVEGETLACGSGAVAVCALLSAWELVPARLRLMTQSGSPLVARVPEGSSNESPTTLRGEGRLVFRGRLGDLIPAHQR